MGYHIDTIKSAMAADPVRFLVLTPEQAAAEFETPNIPKVKRINLSDLERYLWDEGVLFDIHEHGQAGAGQSQRVAKMMDRLFTGKMTTIDVNHSQLISALDVLVSAGLLTASQKDEIIALGIEFVTLAQELKLPMQVKPGHIEMARAKA